MARTSSLIPKYKLFYISLFVVIIVGLVVTGVFHVFSQPVDHRDFHPEIVKNLKSTVLSEYRENIINVNNVTVAKTEQNCTYYSCFNVYPCSDEDDSYKIKVHVYPLTKYLDGAGVSLLPQMSRDFLDVLTAIVQSEFYTNNPDVACLFVPPIDVLNQNNVKLNATSQVLASLSNWKGGENHLLFNMLPGSVPDFNTVLDVVRGKAILAGGGFSSWTYRNTYDVSIPIYNPLAAYVRLPFKSYLESRNWLLVSAQLGIHREYKKDLNVQAQRDLLVLDHCDQEYNYTHRCSDGKVFEYPHVLQDCTFCLVIRTSRLGQAALSDALQAGCIPIIVADTYIMPFSEVLDWKRAAIVIREEDLPDIMDIVKRVSHQHIEQMRRQVTFFWTTYFSTMKSITLTTLRIINDRVFPYAAKRFEEWNSPPDQKLIRNPLFLPMIPAKSLGFTAVILTYDRLESLFRVIKQVSKAPSLVKVLVVWNNQNKSPPAVQYWPKISKPLKIVQTLHNRLSNRFFPYNEIETEAILAIDDDIVMLTADELEFGYQVWREFPDRLVGFPSRLHLWDNSTNRWRYESEWTNDISLVLTGAAFYHKYYSFMYTNSMPGDIKNWVDEHVNCEDIAMNFLIANATGKAPIKVTPRKKFKCPECINVDMLSSDISHMVERSECINKFSDVYGEMPLKTVEFRADPVLYKDAFPPELKDFNDVGNL